MDNKELGRLVLKQVTEYPETFNMRVYGMRTTCGTIACLAGHAMLLSGYTFEMHGKNPPRRPTFYRPDGTVVQREDDEAMKLLGMRRAEGPVFHDFNNMAAIEKFRRMVEEEE